MNLLLWFTLLLPAATAFQFMSNWKMPTYDPHAEEVQAKFGDRSTFTDVMGYPLTLV